MKIILLGLLAIYASRKSEVSFYMLPDDVDDSVQIIVFTSFNGQDLVFYKENSHYRSSVEIQVEIFGRKRELLFGNYWTFDIVTATYQETRRPQWYQRFYVFKVKRADLYDIRCRLKDREGNILAYIEKKMKPPLRVSDPILIDSLALAEGQKRPSPRFTRSRTGVFYVRSMADSLPFRLELVSVKPLTSTRGYLKKGDNFVEMNFERINSGTYKIVLTAENEVREGQITLFSLPIDFTSTEFNQTMLILSYLVPSAELDSFSLYKKAPDSLRSYWERFWKRRDPTPESELNEFEQEFWNRVEFADENYSSHFRRGALSDRGLCYIVLGPPDEIERHPFDLELPAYEVWYYYGNNYKFVFMDLKGVGDYEIVDPPRYTFYEILKR